MDRDELRFRAPQAFNDVIRATAESAGATVVDVQSAFAAASSNGIIGAELMLEHVHPNVEGYFQLASAFFPPLVQWAGPAAVVVDDATARAEIPVTEVDRLHGEYRLAMLKNDWPFVPERRPTTLPLATTRIEEIAHGWFAGRLSWLAAMNEALVAYQQLANQAEAARVAVNVANAIVNAAEPQYTAGRLLLQAEQPERGLHFLRRAVAIDAEKVEYRLSLAQAQFMLGRPGDSIATLEAIVARHPEDSRAKYWLDEMRRAAQAR
jgi:tetratricopeptide (TPR) repeat protein